MKHEKDNLYVVDFAEGFILEATLEPFSKDIDALEEELYAEFSDEEMSELGFTIGNDGKKISVKSKVLSNADLWEHDLFYAEDFNFEKIGENLRMTEEDTLLIKQPTAEADN